MNNPATVDPSAHPTLRMIGISNLSIAVLGLVQLFVNLVGYRSLGPSFFAEYAPFLTYRNRFLVMSMASALFLLPLAVLGLLLLKRRRYSVGLSKLFFVVEIIGLPITLWTLHMPSLLDSPVLILPMVAAGVLNAGILLQIVTAYPLVGLLMLLKAARQH